MSMEPPPPHNEFESIALYRVYDIWDLEDNIAKYLGSDSNAQRFHYNREYLLIKAEMFKRLNTPDPARPYHFMKTIINDTLHLIYESEGTENLVSLRWGACSYPEGREFKKLTSISEVSGSPG